MLKIFKKHKLFSLLLFIYMINLTFYLNSGRFKDFFYIFFNDLNVNNQLHTAGGGFTFLIFFINFIFFVVLFVSVYKNNYISKTKYILTILLTFFSSYAISYNIKYTIINLTGYDSEGYNIFGYNREGYNKNKYDKYGFKSNGLDKENKNEFQIYAFENVEDIKPLYFINNNVSTSDLLCNQKNNIKTPLSIIYAKGINNKKKYSKYDFSRMFRIDIPNVKSGNIDHIYIDPNDNKNAYGYGEDISISYRVDDKKYIIDSYQFNYDSDCQNNCTLDGYLNFKYEDKYYSTKFLNNFLYVHSTDKH